MVIAEDYRIGGKDNVLLRKMICSGRRTGLLAVAMAISSAAGWAQSEPIDFDIVNKIRDQGFNHSQVMEYTGYLSDVIGPRLAATPAMRAANDWTLEKFNEFGLENAHLESFEFWPRLDPNKINRPHDGAENATTSGHAHLLAAGNGWRDPRRCDSRGTRFETGFREV